MDLQLARTLFNPMRVRILSQLNRGAVSTSELAARLDESVARVSYHSAMLAKAGCIRVAETRRHRGHAEQFYELTPRASLGHPTRQRRPQLSCLPVLLDERGWEQVGAIIDDALERISAANEESAERLAAEKGRGIAATMMLASFFVP